MTDHEKGETQAVRGNQEVSGTVHDSDSREGIQGDSGTVGGFNVGVGGANWSGQNSTIGILLGGIIEQLLASEEQRLKETRECVEWYEREEGMIQTRIEKLKQLQEVALSSGLTAPKTEQTETNEEE